MTNDFSRRDFIKLAGTGLAVTTAITGCGPASRYTTREPYYKMPEYTYNGQSTYYATTCRECAAGCGLMVRTMQGRAIKVEGNPLHPVNMGKTCARGQNAVHGLYNPDRITAPAKRVRGESATSEITWEEATTVVAEALKAGSVAFLSGMANDAVYDLAAELCAAIGSPAPLRYSAFEVFESQATLRQAAKNVFSSDAPLHFDLANADVAFCFGSGFLETWQNPVANTRAFSKFRRGGQIRGHLVVFEPRMSQTAMKADEWVPVAPGTEGLVAAAISKLVAEKKNGTVPAGLRAVDIEEAATASGVSAETLDRLATVFANAAKPLALPPAVAGGAANGLSSVSAVLNLNAVANNLGKAGGVLLAPESPLAGGANAASAADLQDFIANINNGKVKTLFIHGFNPVFEIPAAFGFEQALANVGQVISFSTYADETTGNIYVDYQLPDHSALESFGYQRVRTGSEVAVLSGAQPVVAPFFNTMSTIDLLLAAGAAAGGKAALPYADEVQLIQSKIEPLMAAGDGYYGAADLPAFWASFQQFGGWWKNLPGTATPAASGSLDKALDLQAQPSGEGEFFLHAYMSPVLAESGANKPWLQEVPDPATTIMWNTWLEMNPETAHELGLHDDDVVKVISEAGEVELAIAIHKAIRPDVVAIPFGQGHTNNGRYASGRGANPANLFSAHTNAAGDVISNGIKVKIEKTGKQAPLSRLSGYAQLERDLGGH